MSLTKIRGSIFDSADNHLPVNVKDFGAKGDGATDDTAAIQAALTAAGNKTYGGTVYFPAGNYLIDVTSASINIPSGVSMVGLGTFAPTSPGTSDKGSTIYVTGTANAAFLLNKGCQVKGMNFWYPDQVMTSPPTAYDYTLELDLSADNVQGVDIVDCVFYNSYNAINLGGTAAGKIPGNTHIDNCRFYALNIGVNIGYTLVNLYLTNCTFGAEFWTASVGQAVRQYVQDSAIAVRYEAGTGIFISDLSVFGYYHAIDIVGDGTNGLTFFKLSNSILDGCKRGLVSGTSAAIQGGTVTGCTFAAVDHLDDTESDNYGIELNGATLLEKLDIANCYFAPSNGGHIILRDTGAGSGQALINVTGCTFENANKDDVTGASYNILCSDDLLSLNVSGCTFKNISATTDTQCIRAIDIRDLMISDCLFWGLHDYAIITISVDRNLIITDCMSFQTQNTSAISLSGVTGDALVKDNVWDKDPAVTTIASATTMALSFLNDFMRVSGTTSITALSGGERLGRIITLAFNGALTFTDGNNLKLAGNLSTTADDTITLQFDGTNWIELSRSVN